MKFPASGHEAATNTQLISLSKLPVNTQRFLSTGVFPGGFVNITTASPSSRNGFFGGEEVATLSLGEMPVGPVVQHPTGAGAVGSSRTPGTLLLQLHLLHLYLLPSHDTRLLPAAIFLLPVLLLKTGKSQLAFLIKIRKTEKQLCLKDLFFKS